jgi:prepilin-type N-terminal cleavage/methylation domain-containing protein
MSTRRHSRNRTSRQAGFTLVECLVVVVVLLILGAVLMPFGIHAVSNSRELGLMQQGTQMYKAIFSKVLDDPNDEASAFPTSTNGFTTSTQFFVHLVTNRTLTVDFTFFGGPGPRSGLARYKTTDPNAFKADGNAWNVVLDVQKSAANAPFMMSRNLLRTHAELPTKSGLLNPGMLGEPDGAPRLSFHDEAGVVITKAGMGYLLKAEAFTENRSASALNPTPDRLPILHP